MLRSSVARYQNALLAVHHHLTRRNLPIALALIAMVCTAPAVNKELATDDLIQRAKLLTGNLPDALTKLFVFVDEHNAAHLRDTGAGPWWSLGKLHIAFFRPVTAFTHWLDYRLWPDSPVIMHVHSIIWYGSVCLLATLFFRQLMGTGWIAGLAALFFALDDGHTVPVVWLANRNALLAVFFGLLAIMSYDRWRREGHTLSAVLAPVWLAFAVLSAEIGVGAIGYLIAYAILLDRGRLRKRLVALVPSVGIVVVWQIIYHRMGYGVWGSEYYLDPLREPLRFAAAVVSRGPMVLLRQWVWPYPAFYTMLSEPAHRVFLMVGLLCIAGVLLLLIPLVRSDRTARFWALGMALAVVPICAKDTVEGATLIFVGIGAMGLMAQFIGGLLDRAGWLPVQRAWRVAAWGLCGVFVMIHAVYAPIQLVLGSLGPDTFETTVERFTDIGPMPDAPGRDAVIVNAPSPLSFTYLEALRTYRKLPMPAHLRVLAPGYFSVAVACIDSHTVVVRPENGYLVPPGGGVDHRRLPYIHPIYLVERLDRACRSGALPMERDQRIELTGMTVVVTGLTKEGRPSEATIRFARRLDDPALVWLLWDWQRLVYVPFTPPRIGEQVRIPGVL